MELEMLKRIITDQRRMLEKRLKETEIIEREFLGNAKKFLKAPNILVVQGPRRAGKSVFSYLLAENLKEDFGYVNFDDERLVGFKTGDLDKVLQVFYELYGDVNLIILDEVQNVDKWELFASRLRVGKKLIVTGSNSKLLSGELATHLTGRHIDFTLYPFSFREILGFKPNVHLTEDIAKIRKRLGEYIKGSGFPEFSIFGQDVIITIYNDIINKDCIRRYAIREQETFRELAKYLLSNSATEFTYSKLGKYFNIKDQHTAKNYVGYMKDAFMIIVLERFSPKLKEQSIAPKKVYSIDQGLCNFIGFSLSDSTSKIMENIVCIELMRKRSISRHLEIYYWKDHQQREVDFVLKEKEKVKQLIQVSYNVNKVDTKEREIRSLLRCSEELKCSDLLIITWDYETEEMHEGKKVRFISLWKWLLQNR